MLPFTSIDNVNFDSTAILIKYTYGGDADLNGQVDVADIGILATNWQGSPKHWHEGDFDYNNPNGTVDVADLGILASNWQAGVGSPMFVGGDPVEEFMEGIEKLELSENEIAKLLEELGGGGGDSL